MNLNEKSDLHGITHSWEQHWSHCPPLAEKLRSQYSDRWVRFHSLPQAKRYPQNESEYGMVLDRHNTILTELNPGHTLLVITTQWPDSISASARELLQSELALNKVYWQDLPADSGPVQVFLSQQPWRPRAVDRLLRAVVDGEIEGVILAPPDFRWLYHPYSGGADVILPSSTERDTLKEQHHAWTSKHPSGL